MNKKRKEIILKNRISQINTYVLGGYEQKVLLDGKETTNPIMIALHGGLGMPIPFSVGCRGMFPEFTEHFIMVYWDQLGCGINNHFIDDNFSIDNFTDMTIDLIKAIRKDFPSNQLILLGVSWGSVLATKAVTRVPELVDNVIVYGQILKNSFFNEEVYQALNQSKISPKNKKRLIKIQDSKTHTTDDLKEIAKFIRKYTEGYQAKTDEKMPIGTIIGGLLTSPDYTLKDFIAIVKNGSMKNTSIWKELMQIDLSKEIENVQVPYHILQGATDIVTSTKAISEFVAESQNSNLRINLIEKNGHIPGAGGIKKLLEECIRSIRETA
jgi:pimeloyl-ACP methyl ester carboxylesterase